MLIMSENRENGFDNMNNSAAEPDEEMLSEAQLEAFYQMAEQDTPDLWSRIEAGYQNEMNMSNVVDMEAIRRKKLRRKYLGVAAAVVLVVLIAVPTMMLRRNGDKKEDGPTGAYSDETKNEAADCVTTEVKDVNESAGCESMDENETNQSQDNEQSSEAPVDTNNATTDDMTQESEHINLKEDELSYRKYYDVYGTLTLQDIKSVEMYYDGDEESTKVEDERLEEFISGLNKLELCKGDTPELFFDDEITWYNVTYSDERFITIMVGREGIIIDNVYYSAPEKQLRKIKYLNKE